MMQHPITFKRAEEHLSSNGGRVTSRDSCDAAQLKMAQATDMSSVNYGSQVGINEGTINNTFHHTHARPRTPPPAPFASIPFSRDPNFVPRGDILEQIESIRARPPHRAALVGLGGVGKSQLAIEFAHRVSVEWSPKPWVFWVHAEMTTRVLESFRTIADHTKIPGRDQEKADIPQLVYNWLLDTHNGTWIIVLDSADNANVWTEVDKDTTLPSGRLLLEYLPQTSNGSIIVTTRDKSLADKITGHRDNSIHVGPMTEEEGLSLLKSKLGSRPRWDQEVALDLVQSLDLFPLAIAQAGAYVGKRYRRCPLNAYLRDFKVNEQRRAELLSHDEGDLRRVGALSNALFTTWEMSYNYLWENHTSAAKLLALMSFFDRRDIPDWVLSKEFPNSDSAEVEDDYADKDAKASASPGGYRISEEAHGPDSTKSTFEDDITKLEDFSLITIGGRGDAFELHRLVQFATRKWLVASGREREFMRRFVHRMAKAFPSHDEDFTQWRTSAKLLMHAVRASTYCPSPEEPMPNWVEFLANLGKYLAHRHLFQGQLMLLHKIRAFYHVRLGREHEKTLASMVQLAFCQWDQNQHSQATALATEVMSVLQGEKDWQRRWSLHFGAAQVIILGLQRLKRFDKAIAIGAELVRTAYLQFGPNDWRTLKAKVLLSKAYWHAGRTKDAMRQCLATLESLRSVARETSHVDIVRKTMHCLIDILRSEFHLKGLELVMQQLLDLNHDWYGAGHPRTYEARCDLALVFKYQQRDTEALELIEQCIGDAQRVCGLESPQASIMEMMRMILMNMDTRTQRSFKWNELKEGITLRIDDESRGN